MWTPVDLQKLTSEYPSKGPRALAEEMGRTYGAVQSKAASLKLKCVTSHERSTQSRANSNPVNYRLFHDGGEVAAYIAGFIWADGTVRKDGYSVKIGLHRQDEPLLETFKRYLNSNHAITRTEARITPRGLNAGPSSEVNFCSKRLVEVLTSKYELRPAKSYQNLSFPAVNREELSAFVRGYWDGDGYISQGQEGPVIGFLGTPLFVQGLQDALVRELGLPRHQIHNTDSERTRKITWAAKSDVLRIAGWLYRNKRDLYLPRKWEVYQAIQEETDGKFSSGASARVELPEELSPLWDSYSSGRSLSGMC